LEILDADGTASSIFMMKNFHIRRTYQDPFLAGKTAIEWKRPMEIGSLQKRPVVCGSKTKDRKLIANRFAS
jgi:hypothetical protein